MRAFLPDYKVSKVLLDSAHDAMPYYQYFKRQNITPFIDLNGKGGLYIRTTLLLIKMAFLFAHLDTECGAMASKLQKAG